MRDIDVALNYANSIFHNKNHMVSLPNEKQALKYSFIPGSAK
jgi:hypothetical protein